MTSADAFRFRDHNSIARTQNSFISVREIIVNTMWAMLKAAFPGKWDEDAVKEAVARPSRGDEEADERNKMIEV